MTILIVEDDSAMQRLISSLVAPIAHQVHCCGDGLEAIAAFVRHRPDWVLMDLSLPGIDGIEATRRIRASFPEARVVIVTNYDDTHLRQAAQAAGAVEFVSKTNLLRLLDVLRSLPE